MLKTDTTRHTQRLSGVLIGLVLLGIALLLANVPGSPLRNTNTPLLVLFALPVLIALVTYVRFVESVIWWEVGLVTAWAVLSMVVTTFVAFLATMGTPGGYPGAGVELARQSALFLAATIGLSVPYGYAGMVRHEHPRRAMASVLLAAGILFIAVNLVAVAI